MRIPGWRVAVTGGAALLLAVTGVGWVLAADDGPGNAVEVAAEVGGEVAAGIGAELGTLARDRVRSGAAPAFNRGAALWRLAVARHLVHAEVQYLDRAGDLVEHHLDHGTIQSIVSGSITISEADGSTVTVTTDDDTIVRLGRARGELADLEAGDEIVVHSRIDDGAVLARHVLRLPSREVEAGT